MHEMFDASRFSNTTILSKSNIIGREIASLLVVVAVVVVVFSHFRRDFTNNAIASKTNPKEIVASGGSSLLLADHPLHHLRMSRRRIKINHH